MRHRILQIGIIVLSFFFLVGTALAQEGKQATLYLFWAEGCPHCEAEKVFLNTIKKKYPQLTVKELEITKHKENLTVLKKVGEELGADVSGVPFTVVGKKYFVGFMDDDTTGSEIEKEISCAIHDGCVDVVENLFMKDAPSQKKTDSITKKITLPFLGTVDVTTLSLPLLTVIVALLDGFNPCAMWTLLFLISLLLGMRDRKKMWILGTAFIFTSAFGYFLFMSAWLNFFLFLGYVVWVRGAIGLVALGAGLYYLKDYATNKSGGCKVTGGEKRQKVFERIKAITQDKNFIVAFFGIILLAFAVNLVELICSAGLPAIYTHVLTLAHLPVWKYYLYLIVYILIFMLDDLFVFVGAMVTLHAIGLESKYARISHLVGGILMLIIGLLLLFKPEILMFG